MNIEPAISRIMMIEFTEQEIIDLNNCADERAMTTEELIKDAAMKDIFR